MKLKLILLAVVLLPLFGFTMPDCGVQYEDIRRLSSGFVVQFEKQNEGHAAINGAFMGVLDNTKRYFFRSLDDLTAEQVANRNQVLLIDLAAARCPTEPPAGGGKLEPCDEANRKLKAIQSAATDIQAYAASTAVKKQQITDHVELFRSKVMELNMSDADMLTVFKEIDRFVQVKQVPERLGDDLINRLNLAGVKNSAAAKEAVTATQGLLNIVGGKPQ